MHNSISTAMILAAGLGSRLKPWTDHHPKALAIVNGKSLLERNILYLQNAGIFRVVINVHHFADQIQSAILENNGWGSNCIISDETSEVLETGGGLLKAKPFLETENNFLLMNCDILTDLPLKEMMAFHFATNALSTLAVTNRKTSRYLLVNNNKKLVGWCNDKTGEQKLPVATPEAEIQKVAFSGIHMLKNDIFDQIPFSGKFSMIDWYLAICNRQPIAVFDHSDGVLLDVGKPESLELAANLFR